MREARIGKHKIVMYDAIGELPMRRFHVYNKYLLIDAGIGSDMADFDAHMEKIILYLRGGKVKEAAQEMDNMRQQFYFVSERLSPRDLSFAALVAYVDGTLRDDLSDDGLRTTAALYSDAPVDDMTAPFEAVKKKMNDELVTYFPSLFDDPRAKEYSDSLRRRTLAVLQNIIHGESAERNAEVERLTMRMMEYNKPRKFSGKDGFEVQYDKQLEKMCLTISQHLHADPHEYSVLQFYNAYEYIIEMSKQSKK